MSLSFEPRTLHGDAPDHESLLVSRDKRLVALLIRLSEVHGEHEGHWFVDWGYREELMCGFIFRDLEAASDWIAHRLDEIGCPNGVTEF